MAVNKITYLTNSYDHSNNTLHVVIALSAEIIQAIFILIMQDL